MIKVAERIPLSSHTTFQVGGEAEFFVEVHTVEELREAIVWANLKSVSRRVIGGGSNILVDDRGLPGLTIKMMIAGIERRGNDVIVGAGEVWDDVVTYAVNHGLQGTETLAAIPGTVGGAVVQNIGAYGAEISQSISRVDVCNINTGEVEIVWPRDLEFGYRHSVFKTDRGADWCVVSATLSLRAHNQGNISYKDLVSFFQNNNQTHPTIVEVADAVRTIRAQKLPDWHVLGTAGSFFKNPSIPLADAEALQKKYPDIPIFASDKGDMYRKVSLAWIIDKVCGMRGVRQGAVGAYEGQALVIVNYGGATANDIKAFARTIMDGVFTHTGIVIEPEVVFMSS